MVGMSVVDQCASKQILSEATIRVLLKFYMKLMGLKVQKLTQPNFSEKFSFFGKKAQKFLQNWVFGLRQTIN